MYAMMMTTNMTSHTHTLKQPIDNLLHSAPEEEFQSINTLDTWAGEIADTI